MPRPSDSCRHTSSLVSYHPSSTISSTSSSSAGSSPSTWRARTWRCQRWLRRRLVPALLFGTLGGLVLMQRVVSDPPSAGPSGLAFASGCPVRAGRHLRNTGWRVALSLPVARDLACSRWGIIDAREAGGDQCTRPCDVSRRDLGLPSWLPGLPRSEAPPGKYRERDYGPSHPALAKSTGQSVSPCHPACHGSRVQPAVHISSCLRTRFDPLGPQRSRGSWLPGRR